MNGKLCEICAVKVCLKSGKPCKEVENYLQSEGIRSAKWIRPRLSGGRAWKEIPFSTFDNKTTQDSPKYQ